MPDPRLVDFVSGRIGKNSGQTVNLAHIWEPLTQSELSTADSDKIFTVPAGKQWMFESARIELTTFSASSTIGSTVARQIEIEFRSTVNDVLFSIKVGATQGTTSFRSYNVGLNLPDMTSFRDSNFLTTPSPAIVLEAGQDIHIYDNKVADSTRDDMIVHLKVFERDNPTT